MNEYPTDLAALATTGDHRRGEERAPPRYKEDRDREYRGKLIETLGRLDWAYVGTVSQTGWPSTDASRFVFDEAEGRRPIVYIVVPSGSRMEADILANPRVGIETHLAVGWLERRKARAIQFQAVASIVIGASECERIAAQFAAKYATYRPAPTDRFARADVLSAVNYYAAGKPQWGYVDFTVGSADADADG